MQSSLETSDESVLGGEENKYIIWVLDDIKPEREFIIHGDSVQSLRIL